MKWPVIPAPQRETAVPKSHNGTERILHVFMTREGSASDAPTGWLYTLYEYIKDS